MIVLVVLFAFAFNVWAQEIIPTTMPSNIDDTNTTLIFLNINATKNESIAINDDDDNDDAPLESTLNNNFGFIILGDWGKGGESGSTKLEKFQIEKSESKSTNQVAVAKAMADYTVNATIKPEFIVAVGDNFYTKGRL